MSRHLRLTLTMTLVSGALALTSCGRRGSGLTLAGSTAFQPFAEKLAEQYMAAHPGENITVQGGGSALGIQSALSGAAQIGMADLVKLPPEAGALASFVVARDGISIVVNPANPINGLSTEQIRGVFNGSIANWKELGGGDGPVTVVSREAGSGTRSSFEEIVGGVSLTPEAIVQDSNGTVRETVANDPNAVGYLSHGLVNERVKPVDVDGVPCHIDRIMDGTYRLVRPVFLLTLGPPDPEEKAFIDYILSREGQDTIRANGLIPAR